MSYSRPPVRGVMNAVSEYPISAASASMRASAMPRASSTTPAGFPPAAVSVNAE